MQNKVIQFDLALFILTKYGVYVNQKHKKTAAVQAVVFLELLAGLEPATY